MIMKELIFRLNHQLYANNSSKNVQIYLLKKEQKIQDNLRAKIQSIRIVFMSTAKRVSWAKEEMIA